MAPRPARNFRKGNRHWRNQSVRRILLSDMLMQGLEYAWATVRPGQAVFWTPYISHFF